MAILVVVCSKHLPVFLLGTENVVGGGWMAILVVVRGKICGKMCGKKSKKSFKKSKKVKKSKKKKKKKKMAGGPAVLVFNINSSLSDTTHFPCLSETLRVTISAVLEAKDLTQLQLQTTTTDYNYRLQLQTTTTDYNYRLQLQTTTTDYNYRLQLQTTTTNYNYRLQTFGRIGSTGPSNKKYWWNSFFLSKLKKGCLGGPNWPIFFKILDQ